MHNRTELNQSLPHDQALIISKKRPPCPRNHPNISHRVYQPHKNVGPDINRRKIASGGMRVIRPCEKLDCLLVEGREGG